VWHPIALHDPFFEAVLIDNSVNKMIESRWQSKEFIFEYYEALFIGYYCLGEMIISFLAVKHLVCPDQGFGG